MFEVCCDHKTISINSLYLVTVVNPIMALVNNDYSRRILVPGSPPSEEKKGNALAGLYRTIFYFARLKPRLMYSVGAGLRALQMTTPLQFIFDPPAGVGAGIDLLALASSSRWPAMLVLGWSTSKVMCKFPRFNRGNSICPGLAAFAPNGPERVVHFVNE